MNCSMLDTHVIVIGGSAVANFVDGFDAALCGRYMQVIYNRWEQVT